MDNNYYSLGGIGFHITMTMLQYLGYSEGDDIHEFVEGLDPLYNIQEWGALCIPCGEGGFVAMVPGLTYSDIVNNIPSFIHRFNTVGLNITKDDLMVISKIHRF